MKYQCIRFSCENTSQRRHGTCNKGDLRKFSYSDLVHCREQPHVFGILTQWRCESGCTNCTYPPCRRGRRGNMGCWKERVEVFIATVYGRRSNVWPLYYSGRRVLWTSKCCICSNTRKNGIPTIGYKYTWFDRWEVQWRYGMVRDTGNPLHITVGCIWTQRSVQTQSLQ